MDNTQQLTDLFSGNRTIQIVHAAFTRYIAWSAPLAAKLPSKIAPTFGLSDDHKYEFRIRIYNDASTAAGSSTGDVGLMGAGLDYYKGHAQLVKLGAGVDEEVEVIQAAKNGDTAFLQTKGWNDAKSYLVDKLSAKANALAHHYLFEVYRGDIFNRDDDGSTYGYGYGGDELIDSMTSHNHGYKMRGCIAFTHPSANTNITNSSTGTTITFNDHIDAGGTDYGNVGAFYLRKGQLLTIYQRTAANTYTQVQDGAADAVVRVLAVLPGTGNRVQSAVLQLVSGGASITLTAGGDYYFFLAAYDFDGNVQDSFYNHTLALQYAAEDDGYLHDIDRSVDLYNDMRGYSVEYDPNQSLYQQLLNMVSELRNRFTLGDPSLLMGIFLHPYLVEVLKDEWLNATTLTFDATKSKVVGGRRMVDTIMIDGVPVISDPYVGPGLALIRLVEPQETVNPVEIHYEPAIGKKNMEQPGKAINQVKYNGVSVPPFLAWKEDADPTYGFMTKIQGYDRCFNYANGWFGLVHHKPYHLAQLKHIRL